MKRNYQNMYIIYIIHTCNIENYDGDIVLDDADEEGFGAANDDMVLALPSSWKYLNIFQISYFVYQLNGDEYYRILVFLYFSFLPSVLISIES